MQLLSFPQKNAQNWSNFNSWVELEKMNIAQLVFILVIWALYKQWMSGFQTLSRSVIRNMTRRIWLANRTDWKVIFWVQVPLHHCLGSERFCIELKVITLKPELLKWLMNFFITKPPPPSKPFRLGYSINLSWYSIDIYGSLRHW